MQVLADALYEVGSQQEQKPFFIVDDQEIGDHPSLGVAKGTCSKVARVQGQHIRGHLTLKESTGIQSRDFKAPKRFNSIARLHEGDCALIEGFTDGLPAL